MSKQLSKSLYYSISRITRIATVLIAGLLYCNNAQSQVFYHLQHTTGTTTYGNTAVTVTPNGTGTPTSLGCFGGPMYIIAQAGNTTRKYTFSLNKPTNHIRMMTGSTVKGQVMTFTVNGQHYNLKLGDLSSLFTSCGCSTTALIINNNGDLEDTMVSANNGCVMIDIKFPAISSFSAEALPHVEQSGIFLDVFFLEDTSSFIKQPFTDTVKCPGGSLALVYTTNFSFKSGNSFTAQLSNASGSFASPVNIGSKATTTGDTIKCVIPTNTPAGNGYRIRIVSSNPADTSLDNQVNIRVKSTLANFSNSSNTPVCTVDTLRLLGSTSSSGVTWLWTGPNSFTSAAEDTFIANSAMNHAGDYILKATLNSTGCSLRDTTTVVIKQTPVKPVANSNSPVCETKTLTLSTSSSTSGVSYSWIGPATYSSTTQNPTVTTSAAGTHAGDYISTATLNGCSSKDTVTVVVLPKPAKPIAAAPNSPLCARQDLQLTASTVTGAGYTWIGPSSFTANTQNPLRPYVQFNHAGKYYVYATLNGCISDTDRVTVVVNTDPIVNIFPTPGTSICPGQQATFTAIPTNGGTTPTYQWRVNGITTGGTVVSYNTTTLNNGDIVTCHMTSTTTCSTPFTDTSNAISMTVLPKMTPSVTIVANPNTSLHPNEPISFTATPSQAGTTSTYQWRRNGKNVGGATSATWGANANALTDGDEICVLLKSNYQCPDPDTVLSNCIKVDIRLGIVGQATNNGGVKVYPNPTTGSFTITSPVKIEKVEISNLLGQKMLSQNGNATTMTIDMQKFAAGVYLIKVNDSYVERVAKE